MKLQLLIASLGAFLFVVNGRSVDPTPTVDVTEVPDTCDNLSFACQDLHIARKCKAVKSCIEIWETIKAPIQSNNEICDLCKQMVQQARDQLLSNETQEEMKEVFEGTCNYIPVKAIATECKKIVDELVPDIIDTLVSRMDPNMVCTVAGLCNNGMLRRLIKEQHKSAKPLEIPTPFGDPEKCKSCSQGMMFVRKVLQIVPENDFATLLLHSCMEEFHGTHVQCAELIFNLLPVYNHFLKTDEKSICSAIGSCMAFTQDPGSVECTLCSGFIGAAKDLRKAKKPLEHVKNYALGLCEQISGEQSSKKNCQDVVTNNFDTVIYLLWTKENPQNLCKKTCGNERPKYDRSNYFKYNVMYVGSVACDVCESVVKSFDDKARDPSVKETVRLDIQALCSKMGNFAPVCSTFVDQYFDLIYNEIFDNLDAASVCRMLRMCPAQQSSKIGKQMCNMCQHYNNQPLESRGLVIDKFQEATEDMLVKSCPKLFGTADVQNCEAFMKDVTPLVYNFLKFVGPETICGQMEMCPKLRQTTVKSGDNMTCEFCEALVSYLKTIIDSKTTEAEFKTAFQNMCKDLKEFSDQCSNLVNEYFDQFYDFLKNNLVPDTICKAIGLCDGSAVRQTPLTKLTPARRIDNPLPVVAVQLTRAEQRKLMLKHNRYIPVDGEPAVKLLEAEPHEMESARIVPGIEVQPSFDTKRRNKIVRDEEEKELESNSIESSERQQLPIERFHNPAVSNDLECSMCKAAVIYLEKELEDNRTVESVKAALDKVCNYFPEELSEQCEDFVNEYTALLIQLLVDRTDPNIICVMLKVCPSAAESRLPKELPTEVEGTPQCMLCEKVIAYLEKELADNRTEEAIKAALEKVCSYLPQKYAKECDDFVEKYADTIIDLFTHEVAPMMVCAALGLCPAQNGEGLDGCTVCQYVLHYLQEELEKPATEDQIKKLIESVCAKLPKIIMENCDAFIEEYGDSLIVLLAQDIDPSVLCVKFKVCPSGNKVNEPKATLQSLKLDTCSTCEMVVNYMDKLLENDDIDSEITKLVEKICDVIPMSARDQCVQIIGAYGPYLLQMIGQLSDSRAVCQAVDLCSRNAERQLLGGEKCTFGPSYWCQSTTHATACNAHEYCKQKMWKP